MNYVDKGDMTIIFWSEKSEGVVTTIPDFTDVRY